MKGRIIRFNWGTKRENLYFFFPPPGLQVMTSFNYAMLKSTGQYVCWDAIMHYSECHIGYVAQGYKLDNIYYFNRDHHKSQSVSELLTYSTGNGYFCLQEAVFSIVLHRFLTLGI